MPRSVSNTLKNAVFASGTAEVFIVLLNLSHADLASDILVTSDTQTTTSNGDDYLPFPFMISMPSDKANEQSKSSITIDAVDRSVIKALRSITSPPTIDMSVVLASDPDTVEAGPFSYTLRSAVYNARTISGELYFEDILNESFPEGSFDVLGYPGLH